MANDLAVELTAFNIDFYDLPKLTGNSREEMIRWAEEAERTGHAIYCKIPDEGLRPSENLNVFEHFNSEVSPPDEEKTGERDVQVTVETNPDGTARRMDVDGAEIVNGEIEEEK